MDQEIASLLAAGRFEELRSKLNQRSVPITAALDGAHKGLQGLDGQRRTEFERYTWARDRLAGVLIVAGELRMPSFAAFGPTRMPQGDVLTDYDRARTWILRQQKDSKGHREAVIGSFYPEFVNLPPARRVLEIAEAHVGCSPKGDKQRNLFSLGGRYTHDDVLKQTMPGGTTCALFMRAVLVAAGDSRFGMDPKKLGLDAFQAHMQYCMGLDSPGYTQSPGFTWSKDVSSVPQRGDLYFIQTQGDSDESGHVGFVQKSLRQGDRLTLHTIDGGQKQNPQAPAGAGHYTQQLTRIFEPTGRNATHPWEYTSSPSVPSFMVQIAGKGPRFLKYWVKFSEIERFFGVYVEGRRIRRSLD